MSSGWPQEIRDMGDAAKEETDKASAIQRQLERMRQIQMRQMTADAEPQKISPEVLVLRKKVSRLTRQQEALVKGIQDDLKIIRRKCGDCECPEDVPAVDCPFNKLNKTMTALLNITMENMKEG